MAHVAIVNIHVVWQPWQKGDNLVLATYRIDTMAHVAIVDIHVVK
jgi:hypothetical protein